jgi:hypothetical protein
MNDADIEFEISMLQDDWGSATCAFEGKTRDGFLWRLWRRESGFPEVERFVNESDTIRVDIALRANFTDDADVDDGFGLLGEHPAFTIAANKQDGNCNGNASAATHLVVRHLGNLGKRPRVYPQTIVAKKRTRAREMVNASGLRGTGSWPPDEEKAFGECQGFVEPAADSETTRYS